MKLPPTHLEESLVRHHEIPTLSQKPGKVFASVANKEDITLLVGVAADFSCRPTRLAGCHQKRTLKATPALDSSTGWHHLTQGRTVIGWNHSALIAVFST